MNSFPYFPRFLFSSQVNVSNTWTMPQEGLNVFYRFFRDRISWFEADAVCQFHHANLVTGKRESNCVANAALDLTEQCAKCRKENASLNANKPTVLGF